MAEYGYTTVFEPLPEGGFSVLVPAIPEICTYGETLEETREMARDAIRCYLESAIKGVDVSDTRSATPQPLAPS